MARLTRREWMVRIIALVLAASFLGSIGLALFYR
jgi:YbbR domain-containing protein